MKNIENRTRQTNNRKLSGSMAAKVVAYFLLAISLITGMASALGAAVVYTSDYYNQEDFLQDWLRGDAFQDIYDVENWYYEAYFPEGADEWLTEYFEHKNSSVEIYEDDQRVFSCYDGKKTPFEYSLTGTRNVADENEKYQGVSFRIRLYVDDEFPENDVYSNAARFGNEIYSVRELLPVIAILSVFVFILSFIFIMCSAGHNNNKEGITPSVITAVPFEIVTFVAVCGVVLGIMPLTGGWGGGAMNGVIYAAACIGCTALISVWATIYLAEAALRLKLGKFLKNTLVYKICRLCYRILRWVWRNVVMLAKNIPLMINMLIVFFGISIVEFFFLLMFGEVELFLLWLFEKVVLLLGFMYFTLCCKKLQKGSEDLAEGNLNAKVDTSKMILDFKEHGENLNSIGEGISRAVEARMRSEHLKTELITNVSHDLKTPLTSIINYAELLGNVDLEKEKVSEYAEVLLRQSNRLKKLLDDLMEASKATTGNLEVNLVPCEIGVLLSQAVGEYEQRFADKQLELITRQPEEPVRIMADGRHLWRIFDNLLNNICKYAQENTRVYLSVEQTEYAAEITFRNISKYALDISAKELEERFVRGDKSRHMEGNGLGLSIAGSLVDLQNGTMELVTDGDLFKVILRFPILRS